MNILLVSKDLREADFLDHELNGILSPVHFDVQHDLQELELLSEPGRYDALLLDASVSRIQSLQIIASLRERSFRLPILVLADPREESGSGDLLKTVADEWIPKKPGYVAALADFLRGLQAPDHGSIPDQEPPTPSPRADEQNQGEPQAVAGAPAAEHGADPNQLLEALRIERERNAALEDAVRQAEARQAQLIEERRVEQENWELAHQGLKEQGAWIENVVRTLRAKHISLLEKHRAEQQKWEAAWKDADQRRQRGEVELGELKAAQEASLAHRQQLEQESAAENTRLRLQVLELEQQLQTQIQIPDLTAEIAAAQARETKLSEEYRLLQEQLEYSRLELEQARKDALAEKTAAEAALRASTDRSSEQLEEYRSAETRWAAERDTLQKNWEETERQRAAIASALENLEATQAETVRDIGSLQVKWEQERTDIEDRRRALEQENGALKSALDSSRAQKEDLNQEIQNERKLREELQNRQRDWDAERDRLSAALDEAQSKPHREFEQIQRERNQLWKQLREEAARYEKLIYERSEYFERVLGDTISRFRKDEAERLTMTTERNLREIERLEEALQHAKEQSEMLSGQLQSERNRLQAELADLSTRYQRLTDTGASGVLIATLDGVVMRCNDAAARMFGFAGSEEALAADRQFVIFTGGHSFLRALQENGHIDGIEWALRGRDGRILRLMETATILGACGLSEAGTLVERIFSDVTQLHETKEELARIETVRDVAASAVQSFNEVCASLSETAGLLADSVDSGDPRHANAERLSNESGSAIRLARQFLSFVRREPRAPEPLDVNGMIAESEVLLRNLAGDDVDFELSLAPHLGLVMADRRELLHILTKLASTSRESLPMGGTLTIETANSEPEVFAPGRKPGLNFGMQVVINIAAAGCGIQPEKRTVILKQMVERAGGQLDVQTDPVAGNIFRLSLPRVLSLDE
jgi:PAS domain-containing protein